MFEWRAGRPSVRVGVDRRDLPYARSTDLEGSDVPESHSHQSHVRRSSRRPARSAGSGRCLPGGRRADSHQGNFARGQHQLPPSTRGLLGRLVESRQRAGRPCREDPPRVSVETIGFDTRQTGACRSVGRRDCAGTKAVAGNGRSRGPLGLETHCRSRRGRESNHRTFNARGRRSTSCGRREVDGSGSSIEQSGSGAVAGPTKTLVPHLGNLLPSGTRRRDGPRHRSTSGRSRLLCRRYRCRTPRTSPDRATKRREASFRLCRRNALLRPRRGGGHCLLRVARWRSPWRLVSDRLDRRQIRLWRSLDRRAGLLGQPALGATPPLGRFTRVSVAGNSACALDDQRRVACWNLDSTWSAPPARMFVDVALTRDGAHALTTDGTLVSWGMHLSANGNLVSWSDTNSPPVGRREPRRSQQLSGLPNNRGRQGRLPGRQRTAFGYGLSRNDLAPGCAGGCGVRRDGSLDCGNDPLAAPPPEAGVDRYKEIASTNGRYCATSLASRVTCWGTPWPGKWLDTRLITGAAR